MRFDKTWTFNEVAAVVYLDIQNVYNCRNVEETLQYNFNYQLSQSVSGIPFFPAIGVRGEF